VRPLEGVRVLDLTRHIPGPYATLLLGQLGAEVVKVEEPPHGDPTRRLPPAVDNHGAVHAVLNENKRSILVNLRGQAGADVIRRLATRSDIFIEGFRPGVLSRRGLGPEELFKENQRLIYCSLSGYGRDVARAGHDINYAARGGFLGGNLDREGRPVLPASPVADMTGALLAVVGVLAALNARSWSGRGQVVETSLLDGVRALMAVPSARSRAGGGSPDELSGTHACYNVYRCRDGRYVAAGCLEGKFWERLCSCLGLDGHVSQQWGADQQQLKEVVSHAFEKRDRDDWIADLSEKDACVEPVLSLAEAAAQGVGDLPLRLSGTPLETTGKAPRAGEDTDFILGEAGYPASEIALLRRAGVVA